MSAEELLDGSTITVEHGVACIRTATGWLLWHMKISEIMRMGIVPFDEVLAECIKNHPSTGAAMSADQNGNTARVVRAGAKVPEICSHNIKLGPGCFCPKCPSANVIEAAPKMLAVLRDIEKWLRPEVVKEPDRTFFWRVVDTVREAEGKS